MHSHATVDITGARHAAVAAERQDLEEMLGDLIENAAKHGSGRVIVTVDRNGEYPTILIEDDGPGIPEERRAERLVRRAGLETHKSGPGSGVGAVSRGDGKRGD